MSKAVIYARYSSFGQREESIEGQLKICREYAEANGYAVLGEYIDRAKSATNDNRADFQRMVADAERGLFDAVLVYQFDRFARNRQDSVLYKAKLKGYGVRVVSAQENISADAAGALLEGLLENMAQFFSDDLAQKIRRGQQTNAEHCRYNGGPVPLGYRVDGDKRFQVDESAALVVKMVFDRYAGGASVKQIVEELNEAGVRTQKGKPFAPNSLQKILRNIRYTGVFAYGDVQVPGGMPRIVDNETFQAVQRRLESKRRAPSSSGGFLLTTKLFCGHCGSPMVGDSGTSKTGKRTHYYYSCKKARRGPCSKKSVRKELIEDLVVTACRDTLTDENIALIAKEVSRLSEQEAGGVYIKSLKKELQATKRAIDNLMRALELGEEAELIMERVRANRERQRDLEARIASEELSCALLAEPEITFFLMGLRNGDANSDKYRRMLVSVLVNRVYLYDDKLTIFMNAADGEQEITKELLEEATGGGVRTEGTTLHHTSSVRTPVKRRGFVVSPPDTECFT